MVWEWVLWAVKDINNQTSIKTREHVYLSGDEDNYKPYKGICVRLQGGKYVIKNEN